MKRLVLIAVAGAILLQTTLTSAADAWIPPIGVPTPSFGIEESHEMYRGNERYQDAGNGPYTIYVNNKDSNCSNRGNGTAKKPRCEIPSSIADPGTVVEIHGGPYDYEQAKPVIQASGEQGRPVFIRGVDDGDGFPVIENANTLAFVGSYLIVENLRFIETSVRTGAAGIDAASEFVSLRNIEVTGRTSKNGTALAGSDIVFYNNHVHHNYGDDRHGTTVARGSDRVWIVDNYYHHNGGDAVQFCHRCRKDPPRNVFVGRNTMHSDRENGVDLKFGKGIVISENTIYGYSRARPDVEWCFDDNSHCGKFSSGSDGSAIVVGSDGAPKNPWILYNKIYDASQGIRVEEVKSAWIIGNDIYRVSNAAISLQKDGDPLFIIGNRIFDVEKGIDQYWRHNFALRVLGNLFLNVRERSLNVGGRVASQSTAENNVFWNQDGKIKLTWDKGLSAREAGPLDIRGGSGNVAAEPDASDGLPADGAAQGYLSAAALAAIREQEAEFQAQFGQTVSLLRKTP